jgi:hypothetical protein
MGKLHGLRDERHGEAGARAITSKPMRLHEAWSAIYDDLNSAAAGVEDDTWASRPEQAFDLIAMRFSSCMTATGGALPDGRGWSDEEVAAFGAAVVRIARLRALMNARSRNASGARDD